MRKWMTQREAVLDLLRAAGSRGLCSLEVYRHGPAFYNARNRVSELGPVVGHERCRAHRPEEKTPAHVRWTLIESPKQLARARVLDSEKETLVKPFIVRQGDVLLRKVDAIPADAKPKSRDNGRVILAYGEVTGHAHQIADPDTAGAALLTVAESATFLRLAKKAQLIHEEHASIDLAPGAYEVIHQREYAYGQTIRVAD